MAGDLKPQHELTRERGALSEQLMAVLQRRIIAGEIPVGAWLRHDSIAEEFAISRTPVREALRMLAAQGIVEIVPNRGARVEGLDVRDILELGDVRAALEGLAARRAAEQISDQQVQRLRNVWNEVDNATGNDVFSGGDLAAKWSAANEEFHSIILQAAANRQLTNSINDLRKRLPHNVSFNAYAGNSRLLRRNLDEHNAIADAIIDQDGDLAQQLMSAHILSSVAAMIRRMAER